MFQTSPYLRRYAHFEGDPATPPAPVTPPVKKDDTGDGDDDAPMMSKEQLRERLQRKEKTTREKLLAELGIEDPEADKALLAEARKRKVDEMSATEKADKAREKAEAETRQAQADLEAERKAIRIERRDTAIKTALKDATPKADKVLKLLRADYADQLDAALSDDGTVNEAKVKALVETARKAYPEDFVRGGIGTQSHSGGSLIQPGDKDRESAAAYTARLLRGRT